MYRLFVYSLSNRQTVGIDIMIENICNIIKLLLCLVNGIMPGQWIGQYCNSVLIWRQWLLPKQTYALYWTTLIQTIHYTDETLPYVQVNQIAFVEPLLALVVSFARENRHTLIAISIRSHYICSLCPILCGPKLLILRRISWRMWVNPTPYQENISCLPNYFHYSIIVFVHFAAIDFFCFFSLPIRSRVALLTCKFGFTNYWLANIGSYARKINVCGVFWGGEWG